MWRAAWVCWLFTLRVVRDIVLLTQLLWISLYHTHTHSPLWSPWSLGCLTRCELWGELAACGWGVGGKVQVLGASSLPSHPPALRHGKHFHHFQWALDRASRLQHEDPTAGLSGRWQHVMNWSTHLLKHCKPMTHRCYRAEMSRYQAAHGRGPAAAQIFNTSFVLKAFLAPGHPHRPRLSG